MIWLRGAWTWLRNHWWWPVGAVFLAVAWVASQLSRRPTSRPPEPQPDFGYGLDAPRVRLEEQVRHAEDRAREARAERIDLELSAGEASRRVEALTDEEVAAELRNRDKAFRGGGLLVLLALLWAAPALADLEAAPVPEVQLDTVCVSIDYARHLLALEVTEQPGQMAHGLALLEVESLQSANEGLRASLEVADVQVESARRQAQGERDLRLFTEDSARDNRRRVIIKAVLVALGTAALGFVGGAVATR